MTVNETPPQRLQRFIDENRLIRKEWGDGYERACLLAALVPETAVRRSPGACPAAVIRPWLAYLTPDMDDCGSLAAWPAMVRRYAAVVARVHVLDDAAWERVRLRSLHAYVSAARIYVPVRVTQAFTVIDDVLQWLDAGAPEEQRTSVWEAVAQPGAYTSTEQLAVCAAKAACEHGETASLMAAEFAARTADVASWVTATVAEGRGEERPAAAAWDRITAATLAALEAECGAAEAG